MARRPCACWEGCAPGSFGQCFVGLWRRKRRSGPANGGLEELKPGLTALLPLPTTPSATPSGNLPTLLASRRRFSAESADDGLSKKGAVAPASAAASSPALSPTEKAWLRFVPPTPLSAASATPAFETPPPRLTRRAVVEDLGAAVDKPRLARLAVVEDLGAALDKGQGGVIIDFGEMTARNRHRLDCCGAFPTAASDAAKAGSTGLVGQGLAATHAAAGWALTASRILCRAAGREAVDLAVRSTSALHQCVLSASHSSLDRVHVALRSDLERLEGLAKAPRTPREAPRERLRVLSAGDSVTDV